MDLNKILPILASVATLAFGWNAKAAEAYGFDFACAELEGQAFMRAVVDSGDKRAHCLAGAGLLKEAQGALRQPSAYRHDGLQQALQLLLTVDDGAHEALSPVAQAGSVQAAFLLLAAAEGNKAPSLNPNVRRSAVEYFETTPQWMQTRFALVIADRLILAADHRSALRLAEALKGDNDEAAASEELNLSRFIKARVLESRGAWREAAALYETIDAPWDASLTVEAKLRRIALLWRTGAVKTEEAVAVLEQLNLEWRGGALGAKVRLALARAYEFNERFYEAVLTLAPVMTSTAPEGYRIEAQDRLRNAATSYFVFHADETDALMLADIHARYRNAIAPGNEYWAGDRAAARILVNAGLTSLAASLLQGDAPADVLSKDGPDAVIDYAGILAAAGDAARASAFLDMAERLPAPDGDGQPIDRIRIMAGTDDALGAWRGRDRSPQASALLAERAWKAGAWDVYLDAAAGTDMAQGHLLAQKDRNAIAAYLADGERPFAQETGNTDGSLTGSLAIHQEETLYAAADLRTRLKGADAALSFSGLLTAQAASLDHDASQQPDPGEAQAPSPAIN